MSRLSHRDAVSITAHPRDPGLALDVLRLAGAAAGLPWPELSVEPAWDAVTPLLARHGLEAGLDAAVPDDAPVPIPIRDRWRRARLIQGARYFRAEAQIAELAGAFAAEGVPLALLKGGSACGWLYPHPEERHLGDLDLLLRLDGVEAARRIMASLGYATQAVYTSPEEEALGVTRVHLSPFVREGVLPVELHVNLLERHGDGLRAAEEAWSAMTWTECGGARLGRLSPEHFVLHTAAHFSRHLGEDFAPLKGLVDLLRLRALTGPLEAEPFWETARRWGVEEDAARVIGILREQWGARLVEGAQGPSVAAEDLVYGLERPRAGLAEAGLERLRAARDLPGAGARVRYVVRLLFPTPEHLRWRYHLSRNTPLTPYYARHAGGLVRRLLRSAFRPRDKRDR